MFIDIANDHAILQWEEQCKEQSKECKDHGLDYSKNNVCTSLLDAENETMHDFTHLCTR